MDKFAISQPQLEAVCLSSIRHKVGSIRAVKIAPADAGQPAGNWELVNLDPMPRPDDLSAILEVVCDLQVVFCLKSEA